MNIDTLEGLNDDEVIAMYEDIININIDNSESVSAIYRVTCANGISGYYWNTTQLDSTKLNTCKYCDEGCTSWRTLCGGTTKNGRYAYECITDISAQRNRSWRAD